MHLMPDTEFLGMASQSYKDSVWSVGRQQSGMRADFFDKLYLLAILEKHSREGHTAWLVAYVPGFLGGRDGFFRLRERDIIKIKVHQSHRFTNSY